MPPLFIAFIKVISHFVEHDGKKDNHFNLGMRRGCGSTQSDAVSCGLKNKIFNVWNSLNPLFIKIGVALPAAWTTKPNVAVKLFLAWDKDEEDSKSPPPLLDEAERLHWSTRSINMNPRTSAKPTEESASASEDSPLCAWPCSWGGSYILAGTPSTPPAMEEGDEDTLRTDCSKGSLCWWCRAGVLCWARIRVWIPSGIITASAVPTSSPAPTMETKWTFS